MEIHVARGDQRLGIFSPEEVRRKLAAGELLPGDLAWTEDLSNWVALGSLPLPAAQPPPLTAAAPPLPTGPRAGAGSPLPQTSPLAVVSLVSGALAFVALPFIAALPAIVCGHVARSQIKAAAGRLGGAGIALAGLLLGYLNLAILPLIALVIGLAIPAFSSARLRATEVQTLSHLRQLSTAARIYAMDHGDKFPARLDDLVPELISDAKVLTDARDGARFIYYGGSVNDPAKQVLIEASKPAKKGGRFVAFVDGSVEGDFRGATARPDH